MSGAVDYAIIVTVYKQTDFLDDLLESISNLDYTNYTVYIVLDNCLGFKPTYCQDNFIYLKPQSVLGDNVKSHRYAIDNFVREHDRITILDSDNLVDSNYLLSLNKVFDNNFSAVQGSRRAKLTKSNYARIDAFSDIYYRYVDRKLLFEAGSSSTLSGSGMAFEASLYKRCINSYDHQGAGFDKIVQNKIVALNYRIAFSDDVIVYDEKTAARDQIVKQRSRWMYTWLSSVPDALSLFFRSIVSLDRNKFLFSVILLRPPLFLILIFTGLLMMINLLVYPWLNLMLLVSFAGFIYMFLKAFSTFELKLDHFMLLRKAPKFIILQFIALVNAKHANKLSVATEHFVTKRTDPQRKRILHVIRQGEVGGGETHVFDLVLNLDRNFIDSSVLVFSDGPLVTKLRDIGVEVFIIPTKSPFDVRIWSQIYEIIDMNNFDIIHAHGTRALSNVFYSAKKLHKPLIYTVHGWSYHNEQYPIKYFLRVMSERFLVKKASITICVSQTNYNEGLQKLGSFKSVVIPNGVPLMRFNPSITSSDLRAELRIAHDVFVIGFVGRVTEQKNPLILLEILTKLPENIPVKLLVVGEGNLLKDMMLKTRKLGLSDKVIYLNFRNDIERILSIIDVYCLLSHWEGLSIGLLEAMAMEKNVIVSDIAGNKEAVEHLKNGIVVAPDSCKVADAIVYLYSNMTESRKLAYNARLTVKARYRTDLMVKKTEKIYSDFIC